MASEYDESDFIDRDFQSSQKSTASGLSGSWSAGQNRPPTREELDSRVTETQQKLTDLKRVQEQLERERAALEEARRRRVELQTGKEEMTHHLTRGIGLLEEAEFAARRDAEQMAKNLAEFRSALDKIMAIREETWTDDNWNVELTKALTLLENARMEWNAARLKWPLLNREPAQAQPEGQPSVEIPLVKGRSLFQLCKLGLALTWPLVLVALSALAAFLLLLLQRK